MVQNNKQLVEKVYGHELLTFGEQIQPLRPLQRIPDP